MNEIKLNLARKWRSKNFAQIVGQELSIRMLKNSLYLGHFFPVYLFSGQRGCGKTTTARVFAAAINCEQLSPFQHNPQAVLVPCLSCTSCNAMAQGKHPDFVEIDAASHTGVDNVRSLIEAASLLPLMGNKKIYLIDEAHMLSKAAFNALLKILEEPPPSVLFILATTDSQKILETVKSRCFQLFFKPVESSLLLDRLRQVCVKENIEFEAQGLEVIVKETEGSVRDALNMLEQVRFSNGTVTKQAVLQVLGHINDEQMIDLLEHVLFKAPDAFLRLVNDIQLEQFSAQFIWSRLIELTRAVLWMKHGVEPKQFMGQATRLKVFARNCSLVHLHALLEMLYTNERLFAKTTAQYTFLEMILLQLCQRNSDSGNEGGASSSQQAPPVSSEADEVHDEDEFEEDGGDEEDDEEDEDIEDDSLQARWKTFVSRVVLLNDPLLNSVFQQGEVVKFDEASSGLDIAFSKDLIFFKEWLDESQSSWLPLLKETFSDGIVFNPLFTKESAGKIKRNQIDTRPVNGDTSKPVHSSH